MKGHLRASALLLSLAIVVTLSSCGKSVQSGYKLPSEFSAVEDKLIAENGLLKLSWDDKAKAVIFNNAESDHIWSTTPYELLQSGESSYSLSSPVNIEYYNVNDGSINVSNAVDCIDNNTISAEKIKNGIKVSYYFDEPQISLVISYVLNEDSLKISFNTDDIKEGSLNSLLNVSLAPNLCSVKNGTQDDYLFIPTGSGALMYTDTDKGQNARKYSGEVYGNDPVRKMYDISGKEEAIRMPVFGVKSGNAGLFAIIDEGEGAATINASAGSPVNKYSNVYASFNVLGYNNAELETASTVILSKTRPENKTFSISYYPIEKDASYNTMAKLYQQYLIGKDMLDKSKNKQQTYLVNIIGGGMKKTHTLGIPHQTEVILTSFSEAQEIISSLKKETAADFNVVLSGFGMSGMENNYVAGGFQFSSKVGGKKGYQSVEDLCKQDNITLFTDYDLIQFSNSKNGFSVGKSTAFTANMQKAGTLPLKRNVLLEDENAKKTYLLKRSLLTEAVEKLCKATVGSDGISLSSLGKTAYSDYAEEKYMMKGDVAQQTSELLKTVKNDDHSILLSEANAYAAGFADVLRDVPLNNGKYDGFDVAVPFYEMVYRGYKPLYSRNVNSDSDNQKQLLSGVEAGVSPSFSVAYSYDKSLSGGHLDFSSWVVYENNRSDIANITNSYSKVLEKIGDSEITSHEILLSDVTKTTFSNGVSVLVNKTDIDVEIDGVSVGAMSYAVKE